MPDKVTSRRTLSVARDDPEDGRGHRVEGYSSQQHVFCTRQAWRPQLRVFPDAAEAPPEQCREHHRREVCSLEASPALVEDPPALVTYAAHGRVEGELCPKNVPPNHVERPMSCATFPILEGGFIDPMPYGFRYRLMAASLETSASRPRPLLWRLPYGKKRDTALKRADLVAFMERTVVMARMAPVTNMFRFPS